MSLQVWLPLNGNLDNQGLTSAKITNNGATIDNNGKIGKCYSFNGNDNYIEIENISYIFAGQAQPFSLALWIYWAENGSRGVVFSSYGNPNTSTNFFAFEINSGSITNNTLRFDWNSTDLGYGGIVAPNNWTHVACTYDGKEVKKYINGVLAQTITGILPANTGIEKYRLGRDSRTGTTAFNGKMNDLRIYDHCLSEKEIREIAKGLVLHYKLNGNGSGGENLLKNTNTASTSYFGLSEQTGGSTKNIVYEDGVPCVQVTRNDTAHSGWGYIWYNSLELNKIKTNTIYTISFDIKASVSGAIGFTGIIQGNATNYMTNSTTAIQNSYIANQWCHIIFNCKTINDFSSITIGSQVVYFSQSGLTGVNTIFAVKNFKLEEGAIATPWSPNPADIQYSSYGYGDNIEWDCSGFGNNGTKSGTITKDINSPRYDECYKFNNNSYIEHPALPSMNYATYSFWVKQSSFTGYGMIYGQKNNPSSGNIPWFAENTESAPAWAYFGNNSPNYTKSSGSLLAANTWYHLCYVWNNGIAKWYINGVPNATQVTYTTRTNIPNGVIGTIGDSYTGTSWSGTPFSGNISDFRIYATVLSDDDIKELYENKISIDSKENLWAYEFIEE